MLVGAPFCGHFVTTARSPQLHRLREIVNWLDTARVSLTAFDSVKGDTFEHGPFAHILLITNMNKLMKASFKRGWAALVFPAIPCTPHLLPVRARNILFLMERTPGQDSKSVAPHPPYPHRVQNL